MGRMNRLIDRERMRHTGNQRDADDGQFIDALATGDTAHTPPKADGGGDVGKEGKSAGKDQFHRW